MIILPIIVFLINFLVLIFIVRYNIEIVILIEMLLLLFMYIYLIIKRKKDYINYKELLTTFLMIIAQIVLFFLFNMFDLIIFPSGLDAAVKTLFGIMYFFVFDIAYLILLLMTNFIKFLIKKLKE